MQDIDFIPVFSKRSGKEIVEVYKEPHRINKARGTIVSGDFIIYVQNGEHYARIDLNSEQALLLAKGLSLAVDILFKRYLKEEYLVFEYENDGRRLEVTTRDDTFNFYIYHSEDHYAAAQISIADANYLAEMLRYDVLVEHAQMVAIQQAIMAGVKSKLSGKKVHNYDPEAMIYG